MSNNIDSLGMTGVNQLIDNIDIKKMNPYTAAALVQMEIAKTNKQSATSLIEQMKEQNDQAKKYNAIADKLRAMKGADGKIPEYNLPTSTEAIQKDLDNVAKLKQTYTQMLEDIKSGKLKPDSSNLYKLPEDQAKILEEMTARVGNKATGSGPFENITRGNDNKHFLYELENGLKELDKYESVLTAVKDARAMGALPTDFGKLNSSTLESLVTSVQHMAENCNSDNQTQMVKLQDKMGQYNSYMQGSNDMMKTGNSLNQSLARTN